ncbi:MAG: hypothetical protein J0G96_07150 [Flavobacteriia bacterium]|nr:hypothetical protein [Flavobacteriia bacterium]OJX36645.1 MAG: hypothetical protein BGO87_12660 [Flavobacteriia bacterium 40-80]
MEFKIQDLAVMAADINYYPALGVAVNKLLSSRDKIEYEIALEEATKIAIGYENISIASKKDYGMSSYLPGMPLWQPLLFKGKPGQRDMLLESAVVELTRTKNIVSTIVQGRDTSVDEFINNGEWQITVSGILSTNEPRYPLEEVIEYEGWMNQSSPIEIEHELMNKLGIYEIVVLSETLTKTPHWNLQAYSFNAKETKPLPLIIDLKSTAPMY